MKCEVVSLTEEYGICGNKARFKILDFECGDADGDYESFWVCEKCLPHFISKNEDEPHYILIKEKLK